MNDPLFWIGFVLGIAFCNLVWILVGYIGGYLEVK
jgi:hypothetical protein